MKTKHFVFAILASLLCGIMTSCGNDEPSNISKAEENAKIFAKYLTDNYNKGDIITFQNENGEKQNFSIKENILSEMKEIIEAEEGKDFKYRTIGYTLLTTLQYDRSLRFNLAIHIYNNSSIDIAWGISDYPLTTDYTISNDTLTLTNANSTAILVKNIGLVKVTSGEHSWELVRE